MQRKHGAALAAALAFLGTTAARADDTVTFSFHFTGTHYYMVFDDSRPCEHDCDVSWPVSGRFDLTEPWNIQSDTTVPDGWVTGGTLETIVDVEDGKLLKYSVIDDASQTSYDYKSTFTLTADGGKLDAWGYNMADGYHYGDRVSYYPVPEAPPALMLVAALAAMAFMRRRA